jgi:3-oxoacyl-[acyl-carrier protein] reductase
MDLGLKNLVALVTASSKGLGRATAVELAREGAKVVICARGQDALYATRDEILASGGQALALPADVSAPETPQALVDATLERFGQLDILVGNAGGPPPGGFLAFDESDWDAAIQLTLMSFVRLCYAAIPALKASSHGSILASTSITVKQPLPNLVLSNSLRLAVTGLVKTLADELGPSGVRVNAICPGSTRTDRIEQLLADRAERAGTTVEEQAAKMAAEIPLGRIGSPDEFGRVAAFLVSPAASFVNGVSLLVDGGAYRGSM